MALDIKNQWDFFQNVQLDDDGNLLVSIVGGGGGSTFTGGTIDNLTATGSTVLDSLTASTIYSGGTNLYDIFLTSAPDGDITRVQPGSNITTGGTANTPIVSVVSSPSFNNLTFSGTIEGSSIIIGSNLTTSDNTNSSIIASNSADIRKSEESGIFASLGSDIANTERSAIIASEGSNIGTDTATSTGAKNSIISSNNSFIDANLPGSSASNNSIIASSGVTIYSTSTLERAVVIGMNNYTASTPGVHVENLIIKSGATAGYIWTSVDSSGRGEWRGGTISGDYLPLSGGTLTGNLNIDGDLSVSGLTSNFIIGGDANGYDYTIDGGDANFPIFNDYGELYPIISNGQTTYIFSEPANVLSISILTGNTAVILPQYPASRQYVVKDKTGNAALFPVTVSGTNVTINGETEYIINLGSKPSITFLWDGTEYITI